MDLIRTSRLRRTWFAALGLVHWLAVVAAGAPGPGPAAPAPRRAVWVRAGLNTEKLVWGLKGGLLFGLHPGDRPGIQGPRGLIRIAYPTLADGEYDLVNFIAIEPVVHGRRGFSELEWSRLDRAPGKQIRAETSATDKPTSAPASGRLTRPPGGAEQLELRLRVERFDNGAHIFLIARQRADRPDELELEIHAEPDSAPLDACILTATMGNKARARLLWLADGAVASRDLYPDFQGTGFAPHATFPLPRLRRTPQGDLLAALTTNEANPAAVYPFPGTRLWYYGGAPVTQYWRKPQGDPRGDLHVAVNARATYWQTARPIPGGAAFENFELRERFREGQVFVFGVTRRTPAEMGFPGSAASAHQD